MRRRIAFCPVITLLISAFILIAGGIETSAQSTSHNLPVKLTGLLQEAKEKNPDIIASKQKWQSAEELVEAQRAFPDPQISYTYYVESVETRVGPMRNVFGARQKFPFYGKRDLKAQIAEKEAEALKASYQATEQEVVRRVKKAFYELFYVQKAIEITQSERDILKRFERIARTKYETGIGSQQNILKVQVEISRIEDRLLALGEQKKTVTAILNTLLARPPDQPLGKPDQPEFREFYYLKDDLFRIARENRPELQGGTALIEKSDRMLKLAKKDYYPDLTVGANYIDIEEGPLQFSDNGQDAFNVMLSINLPIWRKKLSSQVQSANRMIESNKSRYEDMLNKTLFEVEDAYFKIDTARESYSLFKDALIPQADQSMKSAEAGYITGVSSFLDLLDAERTLLSVQFGYWKAYVDYLKRIADTERAVGRELLEMRPYGSPAPTEEE